jgi:two-component system phosphate regulon sensor histidine kinase PhoR
MFPDFTKHLPSTTRYTLKKKISQFWVPFLLRFGGIFLMCILVTSLESWSTYNAFVLSLFLSLLLQTWQLFRLTEWIEISADPNHPENQHLKTLALFRPLVRTIRKTRQTEEKTRKELENLLENFQQLMQILPFGVVFLDKTLSINWCNQQSENHFKISYLKDRGLSILNLVRHQALYALLQDKNMTTLEWVPHHLPKTRIRLTRIPFAEKGLLLISEDISREHQIEQARKQFMANASHELQTPLTILRGYTELLEQTSIESTISTPILRQVDRMSAIIRDLLELSKLEQSSPPKLQVEHLHHICQDVFNQMVETNMRPLHFDCQLTPVDLACHNKEMVSVLENLLSNAIRFTADHGHITLALEIEGEYAVMRVTDDGVGIEQKHMEHLGTRFYRISQTTNEQPQGTGLGLAIVKQIAQRHEGFLRVQSEIHKGSQFSVYIPLDLSRKAVFL